MHENTTGSSNAAFGYETLWANVSGKYNAAFGSGALTYNTANSNSAFGFKAMFYNETGTGNAAFGYQALFKNTTAYNNVAIGHRALESNTSSTEVNLKKAGTSNTAVGWEALKSNTTGWQNTAIGESALTKNTTGQHNTGVGEDVLNNNETGTGNTALGESAIYQNKTGNYNFASGYYALNNTTGNRNIAIGAMSGFKKPYKVKGKPQSYNGSDNIYIGYIFDLGKSSAMKNESRVIRIGNISDVNLLSTTSPIKQTFKSIEKTYIAGIYNSKLSGSPRQVYIDVNGKLGYLTSSIKFKEDIHSIEMDSEDFMKLNPVSYRYKSNDENVENPLQYGLIAEEVKNIIPEMVQTDKNGEPNAVNYQFLAPILLAQMQKDHASLNHQKKVIQSLQEKNNLLTRELEILKQQVAKLISKKR